MSTDTTDTQERRSGTGRVTGTYVQKLRIQAKAIGRAPGVSHTKALDVVAVEAGFHHWHDVMQQHKQYLQAQGGSAA